MSRHVAFYAPLKPPDHPTPSGDRRMARALIEALERGGERVELASRFRSYDLTGDAHRQRRLQALGQRLGQRLLRRYHRRPRDDQPKAWLTYHAYHKSPDWLGPVVADGLSIPYVLAEASFAPKQAGGPWALGHAAAEQAVRRADVVLALTGIDVECLAPMIAPPGELWRLAPFVDPVPLQAAAAARAGHRLALAQRFGLDVDRPWLLTVAMMRADVKADSYRLLAQALAELRDRSWQLLIIGDGPARGEVEAAFGGLGAGRVIFGGLVPVADLAACYAAADLFVWPALREAYGLAMLEAQAAGLPVVAGREGGVPEVVRDGESGILTPPRDPAAFSQAVALLLDQPERRRAMAQAASRFVARERTFDGAVTTLSAALQAAATIYAARR